MTHHNIRCHSPYKHYLMFHNNSGCCGGGICNSIWGSSRSTTYNININDGGFWGGFRNGLGMGFGNLLGGIFGGFMGGMFGGGMGFGFPNFGGWGGGYGNWGNAGGNNRADGTDGVVTGRRKTRTTRTTTTDNAGKTGGKTECKDADNAEILALDKRLNALDSSKDPNEALRLYKEITALIENPKDDEHKQENIDNYKEKLNRLKNNWTFDDDQNPTNAQLKTSGGNQSDDGNTIKPSNVVVTIGRKPVDLNNITLDDIKQLSDEDLASISKDDATKILAKLGYITGSDDAAVGHISNSFAILKLLEKSGVNVEVENRPASDDQWIKGPIRNVEKDTEGKLSYDVDCANVSGAIYKGQYHFAAKGADNQKYKVTSTTSGITVDSSINIEYQGEKQPLKNNSGKVLVKKSS